MSNLRAYAVSSRRHFRHLHFQCSFRLVDENLLVFVLVFVSLTKVPYFHPCHHYAEN